MIEIIYIYLLIGFLVYVRVELDNWEYNCIKWGKSRHIVLSIVVFPLVVAITMIFWPLRYIR